MARLTASSLDKGAVRQPVSSRLSQQPLRHAFAKWSMPLLAHGVLGGRRYARLRLADSPLVQA
jgi:hypothetical protein